MMIKRTAIKPKEDWIDRAKRFEQRAVTWLEHHVEKIGAGVFAWLAVILFHSATVPALLAMMTGLSDRMLPIEMVLLTWAGLTMLFVQAVIQRNLLQTITISVGFILQAVLIALIFFR
jgi:polyferredoxin